MTYSLTLSSDQTGIGCSNKSNNTRSSNTVTIPITVNPTVHLESGAPRSYQRIGMPGEASYSSNTSQSTDPSIQSTVDQTRPAILQNLRKKSLTETRSDLKLSDKLGLTFLGLGLGLYICVKAFER